MLAMSAASPNRFKGTASRILAETSGFLTNSVVMSVLMKPGATAFTVTNVADANRVRAVTTAFSRAGLFTNQLPAFAAAPDVYRQRLYLQNFAAATKNARKYVLLVTNTQDVVIFDLQDKIRDDLLNLSITNSP